MKGAANVFQNCYVITRYKKTYTFVHFILGRQNHQNEFQKLICMIIS